MEKIYLSSPHMGGSELKFIEEAFQTNWISPVGPHIQAFENELATYSNTAACAVLSSGTAAIHLALIILNVQRTDEVICSSFTFSGSCNPIAYTGATPVYVDSEADSWNMDPELLENAIQDRIKKGKKPAAIILVHLYGMPAKLNEILSIARKYEIPLIEDAAEALGSTYDDKKLGRFGDFGVYSFNGNKIITTSGGGALVSQNTDWIARARFLATQARENAPHYEHKEIGYNYRLSNISAGIGRGQLMVLNNYVAARRTNYEFYKEAFSDIPEIEFVSEPAGCFANRWLTTITIAHGSKVTPETLRHALEAANIESRPVWKPMHLQPVFKAAPAYTNGISEDLFKRGLCLPSGSNLTPSQKDRVIAVVRATFLK
jgi:dTDP-4-amino-4,6-dideoxygalactose transaminase